MSPSAGVVLKHYKRVVHSDIQFLSHNPLRLLDDYPGVEGPLKLTGHLRTLCERPFLEDSDCGHVGQGSREIYIKRRQFTAVGAEDAHRSDDFAAQPQRNGMDHLES